MRTHERSMFSEPTEDDLVAFALTKLPAFVEWFSRRRLGLLLKKNSTPGSETERLMHLVPSPWNPKLSVELESLVTKTPNAFIVGFIDILITLDEPWVPLFLHGGGLCMTKHKIAIEVKSEGFSLGAVLRQIKTYRATISEGHLTTFALCSPGLRSQDAQALGNEGIYSWDPWARGDNPLGAAWWPGRVPKPANGEVNA